MSTPSPAPSSNASWFGRNEFLIRRLHSLSGLIPVGAYMVVHLLTNASVLAGADAFQDNVDRIHTLKGAALIVVEWTFIFIPILFHAIFGFVIIRGGESNTSSYPYRKNYRYTLQRYTGMIAFVFIMFHIWQLHHLGSYFGGGKFEADRATSTAATAIQSALWVQLLYAVGVLACVYHLANGMWTMGITWGVWTTPAAQRRADRACIAFGILLAFVGLSALGGMSTADVTKAEAIEDVRIEEQKRLERLKQEKLDELRQGQAAAEPAENSR